MLQIFTFIFVIIACVCIVIALLKFEKVNEITNENKSKVFKLDLDSDDKKETEYFCAKYGSKLVINTLIEGKENVDAKIAISLVNPNGEKVNTFIFDTNNKEKNQKVFNVKKGHEYKFVISVIDKINLQNYKLIIATFNY